MGVVLVPQTAHCDPIREHRSESTLPLRLGTMSRSSLLVVFSCYCWHSDIYCRQKRLRFLIAEMYGLRYETWFFEPTNNRCKYKKVCKPVPCSDPAQQYPKSFGRHGSNVHQQEEVSYQEPSELFPDGPVYRGSDF